MGTHVAFSYHLLTLHWKLEFGRGGNSSVQWLSRVRLFATP